MKLRPYRSSDRDRINAIQHENEDLTPLDPDDPLQRTALVIEDENGRVVAALFERLQIEGILVLDRTWGSDRSKWTALRTLFDGGIAAAFSKGFEEVRVAVPRALDGYAKHLGRLPGFETDERTNFLIRVAEICLLRKKCQRVLHSSST